MSLKLDKICEQLEKLNTLVIDMNCKLESHLAVHCESQRKQDNFWKVFGVLIALGGTLLGVVSCLK